MKVAIIQCPSWSETAPPYALGLLAACLRQAGHEVYCFDLNINFYNYLKKNNAELSWGTSGGSNSWFEIDYVHKLIEDNKTYIERLVCQIIDVGAQVIGFTVQDTSRIFSEKIAEMIKEKDKEKIIIFGGPSCFENSLYHLNFLQKAYIDAICLQEGEIAFLDLLRQFEEKNELGFCQGFAYRDKSGEIIHCGRKELIQDLDKLPFADFSGFSHREYGRKTLPISTSRGCIYRCAFCNEAPIWGRYRNRSAKNIYNEIVYQLKRSPEIENFFFNDSLINGNIGVLNELADLIIMNKLKINWGGQGRIRAEMNPQFLKKLKKAGFSYVSYGLESGSQYILDKMQKKLYLETAEVVIRNTHKAGIRTTVNIIVGFPSETEKAVLETADFIKRNIKFMNSVYFHPLVVMPGSLLWEKKESFDIKIPEINGLNLWHTEDNNNNYKIRLERIEFYKTILKNKFVSNISMFNYYLNLADEYCGKNKFEEAQELYLKAKNASTDSNKIGLVDKKLKYIQNKLVLTQILGLRCNDGENAESIRRI